MSQGNISPQVQLFVADLVEYFTEEQRPFAEAVRDRLARCQDDEEVERVAHGIIGLLEESISIIRFVSETITAENIDLFPVPMGESEDAHLIDAIKALP